MIYTKKEIKQVFKGLITFVIITFLTIPTLMVVFWLWCQFFKLIGMFS